MAKENDKDKRQAILNMVEGKALCKISRSYALFIPQLWVRLFGWEVDDKLYVKFEQKGNTITISPVDKEVATKMMEANNVKIS